MQHWTELRTALVLARLGTVSAAAARLGVHRATVNRHIDVLETALGATLFQRHARGYALTDSGRDMLDVAGRADEMFTDLAGRNRARAGQISGDLVITALAGLAPVIMPLIAKVTGTHPEVSVVFDVGPQLARLEHGEAHVACRAGAKPTAPDYVVLPFPSVRFGLYCTRGYTEQHGTPDLDRLGKHRFIGSLAGPSRMPFVAWMQETLSPEALVLQTREPAVIREAVFAGLGLGFLAEHDAAQSPDLVCVMAPSDALSVPLWMVTHIDLHRTAKVQAFLKVAREAIL